MNNNQSYNQNNDSTIDINNVYTKFYQDLFSFWQKSFLTSTNADSMLAASDTFYNNCEMFFGAMKQLSRSCILWNMAYLNQLKPQREQ